MSQTEASNVLEKIIVGALKVPGVKVNRKEFLIKTLDKYVPATQIQTLIEKGPIEAGIRIDIIDREARSIINKRTIQSSSSSFAAGLPGGLAVAATVPADTLQFFSITLRMAQELAYLYGFKDLWENEELNDEAVRSELILFLGVMFGVSGSAATLRIVSSNMSKQILKKLPQKALTKTLYYPIIKKIAAALGIKITKATFAKGVAKAIPILGGVISGGLTYASMKPMGNRLRIELSRTVSNYSQDDYDRDIIEVNEVQYEISDEEYEEEQVGSSSKNEVRFSVADELLKFKQLLDMGVVTQEEFNKKKEELLSM